MQKRYVYSITAIALAFLCLAVTIICDAIQNMEGPVPSYRVTHTISYPASYTGSPTLAVRQRAINRQVSSTVTDATPVVTGSSATPFTTRLSSAKVQVINNGTTFIDATQDAQRQHNKPAIATQQVWTSSIAMVAAPSPVYVEAASGSLPDKSFMSSIHRAPPEEEGGGTNGPNLDQPVGDGTACLLLLAMGWIVVIFIHKRYEKHRM